MIYTQAEMAWAFNEWTRRYIDNPEDFAREWETVLEFIEDDTFDNNTIDLGKRQAAYLVSLINE